MSEWVTHEGYRTKTIKVNNYTIEINRPILTPEEMAKSEATVIKALRSFGRSITNG